MRLPWWTKLGAKLILARLPTGYSFWQRLGLFRHGRMDDTDYALSVFDRRVASAGLAGRLAGKTVLELGPGDGVASAIIAAAYGARAVLIDSGCFVRNNTTVYRNLLERLKEAGRGLAAAERANTVQELLTACDASYLTQGLKSFEDVEDGSVDFLYSQAVLEHVRRDEFAETLRQCRRVLRSDGVGSHEVDLRDHLGGGLNNLRFRERVWESSLFACSGFYTNRIRFREMLGLFERAGFTVELGKIHRWDALPIDRARLAEPFACLPDDDLRVAVFDVVLRPLI